MWFTICCFNIQNTLLQLMKIFIKTLTGYQFEIECCPYEDPEQLKQRIEDKEGIKVECQRMICAGRSVYEGRTLAEFAVREGSTVHLVLRLRGA
ncbi:hypothetical protein FGO68_gene4696 [Halteria grandinella]|uniref:Ubiquitin-like domain-containing protein n=1 Tax=Halteria grandinella TaxID=5974 RepID=A0A8J8T6D6_HALGN|nr:hypothetical protein FGO68_gene4696 [Halteria grandinella]